MENYTKSEYESAQIVADIFRKNGYTVRSQGFAMTEITAGNYDFIAERDQKRYVVEVRQSRDLFPKAYLITEAAERVSTLYTLDPDLYTPVLVVVGKVSKTAREKLRAKPQCRSVILLSISNLLYMVEGFPDLRARFLADLPFSLDDVVPLAPKIDVARVHEQERDDKNYQEAIEKLRNWPMGEESTPKKYEELCGDVLRLLFAEDLSLWYEQQKSNDGLFRFDLFCKIKHGNNREFWQMAERYFHTKYIVFEFKNYRKEITQEQVFTTVKYLYAKALRSVAIMVAANGADQNARKAIRGILREEGKLIIVLSNADLIEMLELKKDQKEPADYLSHLLDELMVSLEK